MGKKIDEYIIKQIKERADIYEVVSDFVELRKTGVRYTGICPFHDDQHDGNFIVYPKGNCYKCFTCGAKGGPVEFLMNHEKLSFADAIRWLGKKYNIETDMQDFNYTPPPPRPKPDPLPTLILPDNIINARMAGIDDNILVRWIRMGINWDCVQRKRINEVLRDYRVGHSPKNGMTIWWQIDEQQHARTGKMMLYKADGHRDKREGAYTFDWIHSALSRSFDEQGKAVYRAPWPHPNLYNPDKQEMRQTLFGMHLLNRYKHPGVEQMVCIVESEKTAVLMAIAYGNHAGQVWMACGGLENLNFERLKPIIAQQRTIKLFPDRDGIEKWQQKAEQLHYSNMIVDTQPVTEWWKPEDGEKADIADVVIRITNERKKYNTVDEIIDDYPNIKQLATNLQLDLDNETETSE